MLLCTALALLPAWQPLAQDDGTGIDLFDGKSLDGWSIREGEDSWWRVQDGLLTGGSLERNVPHNTFLCTERSFQNFELNLEIRVAGTEGFINSGIQIRSRRVESNHEMSGYQVDAGDAWWGKLYDESRRNRVLSESTRLQEIWDSIHDQDWNHYRILAEGPRIRSWINSIPALDYTETDLETPLDGQLGIQVHSGGKALVQVRSIRLKPLPDTPGAMTWRRFDKMRSLATQGSAPIQTAAEELAGFHLPADFEMELVASEPSMNKVVDLAFDDAGKNATGFDAPEGTAKDECPRVCGALALGWSMSCKGNEAKCGQAAMLEQQLGCTVRCQEAAGRPGAWAVEHRGRYQRTEHDAVASGMRRFFVPAYPRCCRELDIALDAGVRDVKRRRRHIHRTSSRHPYELSEVQ